MLVCVSCPFCTRDRGCSAHPAFPCALFILRERSFLAQLGRNAPRDRGGVSAVFWWNHLQTAIVFVPSPLVGEGQGGGWRHRHCPCGPPTPPSPTRGEGAIERVRGEGATERWACAREIR